MKKALSILLVALMVLSLGTVAFAAETAGSNSTTTLKVLNATEGVDYTTISSSTRPSRTSRPERAPPRL